MIENSLPTLIFFHVDVVKYLNLVSKFLLSCDHKGDYMADVPVPKKLIFVPDEKVVKELSECKLERNSQNWFTYCKSSCENFKINSFEEFYEPELEKFENYTEFIKDQINHHEAEAAVHGANSHRILSLNKK